MPSCSSSGCPSRAGVMHRFPKDASVRGEWIKFCARDPSWVPKLSSRQDFRLFNVLILMSFTERCKILSINVELLTLSPLYKYSIQEDVFPIVDV